MKKSKRQILSLMMAAAMAAGLLTGCGSSGKDAGAPAATQASGTETKGAGAAETEAKTEDKAGETKTSESGAAASDYADDVITYGMTSAWDTINPYGSSSGSIYQNLVSDKLYDRLAFIEEAGTGVSARGAKSWESADDGMAAIFHLDENAKWHDGEPVTAADWVYTARQTHE